MKFSPTSSIQKRVSLKPYNTFGIEAAADYWVEIFQPEEIVRLMDQELYHQSPRFILGGGSNVLFPGDYHGLIIKNSIPGLDVLSEDDRNVAIRIGAGVVWDDVVRHCVENGWGGIENLSMIPGLAGAAPIQNIGAYGVELNEVFDSLEAVHLESGETETFDRGMCDFGYRNSIFKREHKSRYLITSVTLRLDKHPQVDISYAPLKTLIEDKGIRQPTIQDVSRAVREIRSSKLPDPAVTGNAGSFFKNPVIPAEQYAQLQKAYPDMPGYPVDPPEEPSARNLASSGRVPAPDVQPRNPGVSADRVKVPAAWLIEKCGFKGMREGDAGVHERHALILVNHGRATGPQLLGIAQNIQEAVSEKFGITLEPEVNIVNGDIV